MRILFPEGIEPRFSAEQEAQYQKARFSEYRDLSLRLGIAGVILAAFLWLLDYVGDPVGARHTIVPRLFIALTILIYVVSVSIGMRRPFTLAIAFLVLATIELLYVSLVPRLASGYALGIIDFVFVYLVAPLVLLPYRFRENAAALLMAAALPNVFVLFGLAPGFPLLVYNLMIWPACLIAIYAQYQFDLLFRRVFAYREQINELAMKDSLTGLANRRHFLERANEALSQAKRHGRPLCVLALDLDRFKSINDRHGHSGGDDALRFFAAALSSQLRDEDISGRIGGEEFGVILPDASPQTGMAVAERIRRATESAPASAHSTGEAIPLTVSIGVASFPRSGETLDQLLHKADTLLYSAKNAGRNRVVGDPD